MLMQFILKSEAAVAADVMAAMAATMMAVVISEVKTTVVAATWHSLRLKFHLT
jgi:hypothetical protein